jgi:hypothetical protein
MMMDKTKWNHNKRALGRTLHNIIIQHKLSIHNISTTKEINKPCHIIL